MQTYISILRGINVSGHKMIKMDSLKKMYADLGFKNTQTYIQSGNVIFQDKKTKSIDLEKKIAKKIFQQFGFEVPVIVKQLEELQIVLKSNPYVSDKSNDTTHLHVTFLSAEPEIQNIDKIKQDQYRPDEFIVKGSEIYLYCPGGYGNTKLTNNFFESKLKVVATTRNWKTTNELLKIAESISNENN